MPEDRFEATLEAVEFLRGVAEALQRHGQVVARSPRRAQRDHVPGRWRHWVLLIDGQLVRIEYSFEPTAIRAGCQGSLARATRRARGRGQTIYQPHPAGTPDAAPAAQAVLLEEAIFLAVSIVLAIADHR